VTKYPASSATGEAQFRRGEHLFVSRRYAEADRAYLAVISAGESSEFYEQSLYKHGWSLFKLGQLEDCLTPFLDLVARRLRAPAAAEHEHLLDGLSKPERELVDDGLRAMSLAEAQLDGIRSIDALLDRHGQVPFSDLLYASLGDLYLTQERYADAAEAYRGFVARNPTHPRSPYMQARVIGAFTAGKFPSKVIDAERQFVELYGLRTPYWVGTSPAARPEVVRYLKASLNDLASFDHERAQKTHAPDAYARAADWYRQFLDYFPGDPDSAQRNFLLAETLNESGDFAGATAEYRRTAYQYGPHAQAGEAGYAALLAAREHEKSLSGDARTSWHAAAVDESIKFAGSFPGHPQAAAVEASAAEELYARGDLDRAVSVAGDLATRMPPAAPALDRVAWTVMAHAQFDLMRFEDAERSYTHLRQLGEPDQKKRAEIEERIAASVYRQAEARKAAGDNAGAVEQFMRVAVAAPGSSIRPNALYDAAALLLAGKQWPQAVDALTRFRNEFPQHKLKEDVTQQLAVALMETGRSAESATEFEAVAASQAATPQLRREALAQAADLYGKAARTADQRRIYAQFVRQYPQPLSEAMEARQHLADLAKTAGDLADRRRWQEEIVQVDAGAGAGRTDRTRYLAAHAALELAGPVRDAFQTVALTSPLKKSLKAKKDKMEAALAAYGKAGSYGVADVSTAATYETAELYFHLSRDLLASERPKALNKEELEQYQLLLEEQAFPFEEKAIALHDTNASRSAGGIYDDWVRRSFARLAELSPARFARSERTEPYVTDLQ
jgi:TolA-binding protein